MALSRAAEMVRILARLPAHAAQSLQPVLAALTPATGF